MDIARAAGYSQYHAARVFKGETGLSPFEYIRRERLTASARALRAEAGAQDADLPAGMAGLYRDDAGHQHQISSEDRTEKGAESGIIPHSRAFSFVQ